jgi:hypothetical protein
MNIQNIFMAIFILVAGLNMVGAGLPRWATVIGGVCGIIVALFFFLGRF